MAWCPKCKNEYVEGVTVCPDCDIELVDELPEETDDVAAGPQPVVFMKTADREVAEKAVKYLRFSGVLSSAIAASEETDEETPAENLVIVADVELDAAYEQFPGIEVGEMVYEDRLYQLVPDIEDALDEIEEEKASQEFSELRSEASTVYVKKKDKYADLRFSGFSFIGFGVIGVIILVLNILHVINLFNTYSLIVMGVVFLVFFIIGFASLHRAKLVKSSVAVEDEFTETLNEWVKEHLGDDLIDEWYDENKEDQENYFEIQEKMVSMMQEEFPNIHPSYIEEIAEERYNSYLERSAYESPDDVPEADEDVEDVSELDEYAEDISDDDIEDFAEDDDDSDNI